MRGIRSIGLVAVVGVLAVMPMADAGQHRDTASTFDDGTGPDGWTLVGDAEGAVGFGQFYDLTPVFTRDMGNPGGAIHGVDEAAGLDFYFVAPPRFLGDQSAMFGGTLQFDVKFSGGGGLLDAPPEVILAGAGLTLVVDAGPTPPADTWTTFTVALDDSADWRISHTSTGSKATSRQIRQALRDLWVLRIRGEYALGVETTWLDNVEMLAR